MIMPRKEIRVFLQGAFDIINAGHILAFKRARNLGDKLIIGLNTDKLYLNYKDGRGPIIPYRERKIILEGIMWIDKVVPMNSFSPLSMLKKYDIDVFVLTKEWLNTKSEEIEYIKRKGGRISFSPRYKIMCSSDIRKRVIDRDGG